MKQILLLMQNGYCERLKQEENDDDKKHNFLFSIYKLINGSLLKYLIF